MEAQRYQKSDVKYVSGDISSDKWAWVFFKSTVYIPGEAEIIVKAVCGVICNSIYVSVVISQFFFFIYILHSTLKGILNFMNHTVG